MVFWIDAVFGYIVHTKTHIHKRVENFVTYKGFVWPHLCVILSLVDEKWQGSESLYVCAIILYLNFGFLSRIRYFIFTFSSEAYKWLQFNKLPSIICIHVLRKEWRKIKERFLFTHLDAQFKVCCFCHDVYIVYVLFLVVQFKHLRINLWCNISILIEFVYFNIYCLQSVFLFGFNFLLLIS